MKLSELALNNRTVTLALTVVVLGGGWLSFNQLGRLEDPEFTIKTALVVTPYPGATAEEVEQQVTDELEQAIQQLGQVDSVVSQSMPGRSTITVEIKKQFGRDQLPQIWTELRHRVGDVQSRLPAASGPSTVIDDYGDVYGVLLAAHGSEYSAEDLRRYAELLRRELVLVQDVARVELFGVVPEVVYVELNRERMAQLGVPKSAVIERLRQVSRVHDAGHVEVGPQWLTVEPTSVVDSVESLRDILIPAGSDQSPLRLGDLATVRRGYREPPSTLMRFDGQPAVGIGIATVEGGNVVRMGQAVQKRLAELEEHRPVGMELGVVSYQSATVTQAINDFLENLAEAVLIVLAVLLFFMGVRSGLIMGFVLLVTIAGTFVYMDFAGIALQRISLGALVIALGMLVDNAIVIVDGMLVRIAQGRGPERAAREITAQTGLPLLGGTAVAVLAFASIGTSQDSSGEYLRSLFQVALVSLGLSWVTAMTLTPLLGVWFLKSPVSSSPSQDPYDSSFYRRCRGFLLVCLRYRALTTALVLLAFGFALWGFGRLDQSFFPEATRNQFMVDYWLPEGTAIDHTAAEATEVEQFLMSLGGVVHVATTVGAGAPRFLLTYGPEKANPAYALFLVEVDDWQRIPALSQQIERHLRETRPQALAYARSFVLGPGSGGKIQARLTGDDLDGLRAAEAQVTRTFDEESNLRGVRSDWRQRGPVVRPVFAQEQAQALGVSDADLANTLREGFEGLVVSAYQEGDTLLPVVLRAPPGERRVENLESLWTWSPAARQMVPLANFLVGVETVLLDGIIARRNRERTLTVLADPVSGPASVPFARLRPQVEALTLPAGVHVEWGGEYEDSTKARSSLISSVPLFAVVMFLIVMALFDGLRQALVIWLCVPLSIVGVTLGLWLTDEPFGFMAMLGFLSLSGMLIRNAIVLVDEIELLRRQDMEPLGALVAAGISRIRPVSMGALTTMLGMIPLLKDPFYKGMAVTMIGGLLIATLLTLVVVPVLYALFFRIRWTAGDLRP